MIIADPKTREEWLTARTHGIGGSDAGCIVGANPWKSARQLWREKSGIDTPPDISDKPAPFIFATLDGELTDADGRRGILEIKTTTIQNARQWDEWDDDNIPQHYFFQVVHQFLSCEWAEFAELFAHIRYYHGEEIRATLRKYHMERTDKNVVEVMQYLEEREIQFYKQWQDDTEPPFILPEI